MQPPIFLGLVLTLVYAAHSGKKQSTVGTTGDKGNSILDISKPEIAVEKCAPRTLQLPSSDIIVGFAMLLGNVCKLSAIAAAQRGTLMTNRGPRLPQTFCSEILFESSAKGT
jgi:hypothetical protein